MKKMQKIKNSASILAGLSYCLMTFSVNAAECASVSFLPGKVNGKNSVLELVASNGFEVPRAKRYRKVLSGDHRYQVEAGEHMLLLQRWIKGEYVTQQRNWQKGIKTVRAFQPIAQTVHVNLSANTHYIFDIDNNQHLAVVAQERIDDIDCEQALVQANKKNNHTSLNSLPEALQSQVVNTFAKLTKENKQLSNLFPIKLSNYFGTVFDNDYSKAHPGLRVNTVIPHSLAAHVKLRQGDEIIALGEDKVVKSNERPSQLLNGYLEKLSFGQTIELTVNRNGQQINLQEKYLPVIVPEVFYQQSKNGLEVINQTKLSGQLQFEFDQLILALADYYAKQQHLDDVNLLVEYDPQNNAEPLMVSIGFSALNDAKQNLLSLNENSKDLDLMYSKHNKMRARSGQSLYHDYINKAGGNNY